MARLPVELITTTEVFQAIASVSPETGIVEAFECSPGPPLLVEKLRQIVVGRSLSEDNGEILLEIEQRLFHRSKKAVIVAIKDMIREYRECQTPKNLISSNPDPFNR